MASAIEAETATADLLAGPVREFLGCATPEAWLVRAGSELPLLLVDHAHCEKKAASTALSLMYRYPEHRELLGKLAQLAREELLHFEQVLELMDRRKVAYGHLSPSRYASGLRRMVSASEPDKCVDTLIVGAIIEARSCERFAALAPRFRDRDPELSRYYRFLLKSESRHFEDYLSLARLYARGPIEERVAALLEKERVLIESPDPDFRFHSGVPAG